MMKKTSSTLLYSIIILFLIGCQSSSEELLVEGVSKELADFRKNSLQNIEYDLHITIPEQYSAPILGSSKIQVEVTDQTNPLILDFKVPEEYLKTLTVNGNKVQYEFAREHIIINQSDFILGANSIEIQFQVGETSLNRQKEFLYTLFVPERARTAFPCFDQPNLKASFTLSLEMPAQWKALSNSPVASNSREASGQLIQFEPTELISTYLFDFVAGAFQVVTHEVDGRSMTMLHRESDSVKVNRNLDDIFNLHSKSLSWLEDYTGIPYPFKKFDFALIPSFQYGGMEHPGAITYKAESLFLNESPTQNQLLGRASLIAHETAHMWFGDLVTMDWFNDVWMKEVFANFMAAKIVNPSFPELNHDLRFLLAHYPAAYSVDRSKGTHPIQQPLENLKDAGTLYGAIIYQKAPIVMRMLERKVGEDLFKQGMQTYLNNYSYNNATWDDLIAILDSASEDEVSDWSNQWIKEAGMPSIYPYISTSKNGDIKEFSFHQRDHFKDKTFWSQNLLVLLEASDSTYKFNLELDGSGVNLDEAIGLRDATFILCNSDGYGYGYFRMGPLTKTRWLDNIEDFTDPVQRGVGWISLWESMLRQELNATDLLKTILRNIKTEKDPLIQQYILGRLQSIYWDFLSEENRIANSVGIEDLLWRSINEAEDSKLKRAYYNTYRSIAISEEGTQRLYQLWSKELSIEGITFSETDFITLACELAVRNWPESNKIIMAEVEQITNEDRKQRLQFLAPSLSANKQERDEFFKSLSQEENRQHESWVQSALGYLHHPLRANESVEYIAPTLEMLEEIQMTGDIFFPKRVLDNTFSGHRSPKAIDQVNQFLYRNNHYPANLKNKILQSADLMFRAQEIVEQQKDSIIVLF